ncbi:hypothetical protein OB919_06980 [Halobacteria archaeon AArc-curdl1]|uniref:Uncharacterized protein n=1 Tax=Natronosalvus hydrolyticus TaxID=2979988 RepID=A0AAP2Z7Y2_9EURY|nr:hypothetical protein [Halobacteria archaeon AArc-curdl1]
MTDITRRQALAATGLTGAVALAGCAGAADDDGGSEESNPEGTILGEITVENLANTDHTVDVLVEFDGEIEHWSTHEFDETSEGVTLEGDWPDDHGSFRVTARLDEGKFTNVTPGGLSNPSCVNLFILVQREGSIRIAGVTDGGPCGSGDAALEDAEDAETDE